MLQHGISICVFSWYDTFNCLGTELQLWDIERHQWIQVKATTVESPGPGMECWRHGGEMEGWWTVTVHVVSVVCSHPAPHRAGTSQDTFPGFSPGFFLPDPLTCSRDTARVTGKYLSTEKKIFVGLVLHSVQCCLRCNVTQTHPDWFQAPVTTQDNFSGIIFCVPLAAANAARRCYVISR